MKLAVIETGGKQYVVSPGKTLSVEKLSKEKGSEVTFDKVLLMDDGKGIVVGSPYIEGATVMAEVVEEGRGKKVTVIKYKNKTRYNIKRGHRQPYTKIKIAGKRDAKPEKKTAKSTAKKAPAKTTTKTTAKK